MKKNSDNFVVIVITGYHLARQDGRQQLPFMLLHPVQSDVALVVGLLKNDESFHYINIV